MQKSDSDTALEMKQKNARISLLAWLFLVLSFLLLIAGINFDVARYSSDTVNLQALQIQLIVFLFSATFFTVSFLIFCTLMIVRQLQNQK